ncbi:hypothetical protein [Deinococcus humi]|uniref:MarR family transcriptional regulator n=1 Tax=Deinococcus humi TaxID=662880 RepID=A0A7W8NFT3_9DEIO|nr:hypothetical protein [Deinococcus humi]MBB5363073.1 hypothetical protein [Deinococcus humi]GGO24858.1 hypothetical protein GCM10008949_14130 [Deinococcus humi]
MRRVALGPAQAQVLLACTLEGDRQAVIAKRTKGISGDNVGQILARLWGRNLVRELEPGIWALEQGPEVEAALDQAHALVRGEGQ